MKRVSGIKFTWLALWVALALCVFYIFHIKGGAAWGEDQKKETGKEKIAVIETNLGVIKFTFFPVDAPQTVENFIKLAGQSFYDGLIFHRVVKNFVIQGGCPLGNGKGNPGYYIKAEFNDQPHLPGTVAMARSRHPHSAGSQFYICLKRIPHLDKHYTVFGQVIEGMDVLHAIGQVKTGPNDKPLEDVVMQRVYIIER